MKALFKIFKITLVASCIIGTIIFIGIAFDAWIGLGAIPYKNGCPVNAPLFQGIDEFYESKGFPVNEFIRTGIERERRRIYTAQYVISQNIMVILYMMLGKKNKKGSRREKGSSDEF
jgi:hypothetical protein